MKDEPEGDPEGNYFLYGAYMAVGMMTICVVVEYLFYKIGVAIG